MAENDLCKYLEWDSSFFGYRIARITVNRLSEEIINNVMMWCNSNHIDCIYFLGDASDEKTVRLAEDNKFRFVDIRITYEKSLKVIPAAEDRIKQDFVIRLAKTGDVPALRTIARFNHSDSRFFYDSNFSTSLCRNLYESWIENSCKGYADAVLIAEHQSKPIGYITCHLIGQEKGQIGLFGIISDFQGAGLGQLLLSESFHWFLEHNIRQITIVTQGRNCRAQRVYQRCGFVTKTVQLWYHRWFLLKKEDLA